MAYSSAKPRGDADRVSPDDPLPLPLEGPGRCCRRGRSLLRTTSRKRRARRPQPSNVGVEGRVSDLPTVWRMPPWHPRQRTPGRKPGPESLTEPNSEFSRQKIANSVQPWSELAILRSPKAKTHDYLRYRKAPTQTTDKKVHFPLPRPRKTVCFDRQRPKPTVFRIAHPQSEGAAPERGRDSRGRRGARAKVVAPGARAVAPRARARRRARRAYANDTEPSTASSTCWNR